MEQQEFVKTYIDGKECYVDARIWSAKYQGDGGNKGQTDKKEPRTEQERQGEKSRPKVILIKGLAAAAMLIGGSIGGVVGKNLVKEIMNAPAPAYSYATPARTPVPIFQCNDQQMSKQYFYTINTYNSYVTTQTNYSERMRLAQEIVRNANEYLSHTECRNENPELYSWIQVDLDIVQRNLTGMSGFRY
jgi:hypothetical protein